MININTIKRKSNRQLKIFCFGISVALIILLAFQLNVITIAFFVAIIAIMSFKYPFLAIMGLLCSFAADNYFAEFSSLNEVLVIIVMISIGYKCLFYRKSIKLLRMDSYIIFVCLYCIIISLLCGYRGMVNLAAILFFIVIVRIALNNGIISITELFLAFSCAVVFSGIVGLRINAFGLSQGAGSVNRFVSALGDPNFFSLLSVVCVLGLNRLTNIKRFIKVTIILIISVFALLTFSKSLLLLIAINVLYYMYENKIKVKKVVCFLIISSLFILFVTQIINVFWGKNLFTNYLFRFAERPGVITINSLTSDRYNIQQIALEYFSKQNIVALLFGNGYISTGNIYATLGVDVITTHSIYIQILMDFGIIGTLIFMGIFVYGYISACKEVRPILLTYFATFTFLSWQFSMPFFLLYILLSYSKKSLQNR